MSSLLGLESYETDHSDAEEGSNQEQDQGSPEQLNPNTRGDAAPKGTETTESELLDENTESKTEKALEDDGGSGINQEAPTGVEEASTVDAPLPTSKEAKPFFMPLPSPLVRLDHASQGSTSPYAGRDLQGIGVDTKEGEPEENGEGAEEEVDNVDNDIIDPEFRGMLPPEATGQANPKLQAKIASFLDTIKGDFTKMIKMKKDYGNPAVLAQICSYCNVDDKGTNYPEDRMVHPSVYDIKDFHETLMNDFRKAKRPEETKPHSTAATAAPQAQQVRLTGTSGAVGRGAADATAPPAGTTAGTTRKRINKWGSAPPPANALPFMAQQALTQMANAPTKAAAAAPSTGSRIGFSVDPSATARAEQTVMLLNAQKQAAAKGKEVQQQQQAEQLARVQQLIADRVGKPNHEQSPLAEQPIKKPRLQ